MPFQIWRIFRDVFVFENNKFPVYTLKLSSSVGLQWIQIWSHFGMSSGLLSNLNVGSFRSHLSEVQMQFTVFVKYCKKFVAWLFILYNIIAKRMPVKYMEANLNLFCRVSIFVQEGTLMGESSSHQGSIDIKIYALKLW